MIYFLNSQANGRYTVNMAIDSAVPSQTTRGIIDAIADVRQQGGTHVIPVNIVNQHWTALVISRDKSYLTYF